MHTKNLSKLIQCMNWNNNTFWWSFAFFFGVMDLVTTYIGMQIPQIAEGNFLVNHFHGIEFWIVIILLKVFAIAWAFGLYRYLDLDNASWIPATLAIVWLIVSLNNLILILTVI